MICLSKFILRLYVNNTHIIISFNINPHCNHCITITTTGCAGGIITAGGTIAGTIFGILLSMANGGGRLLLLCCCCSLAVSVTVCDDCKSRNCCDILVVVILPTLVLPIDIIDNIFDSY